MNETTPTAMRQPTKIHPQYNDGSNLSRELHATVNLIDAIVDYQESIVMPPEYIPACIQKALQYCNTRTSLIMDAMDMETAKQP